MVFECGVCGIWGRGHKGVAVASYSRAVDALSQLTWPAAGTCLTVFLVVGVLCVL